MTFRPCYCQGVQETSMELSWFHESSKKIMETLLKGRNSTSQILMMEIISRLVIMPSQCRQILFVPYEKDE